MIKMQPYVKKWYDFLGEGKIMGLKCKRCGAYIFPPVTVCQECSGTELDWVEMSGEAKLLTFNLVIYPDPPFAKYAPYFFGSVKLKEGPDFNGMIFGLEEGKEEEALKRLPIPVKLEIMDRDGFKAVAFRIKE